MIPTFSRSLPKNLQELASTLYSLKDFVSMKTLIKQIPFVEDPDKELQDLQKQKDEAIKQQQELFAQGYNSPPEKDERENDGEQVEEPKETQEK